MALVKITTFPALAYPSADDILPIVVDPGGTPVTKKITHRKLFYQSGLGKSTFCGYEAGAVDDLSDNENCAFGYQALKAATTGDYNCAFGSEALLSLTTANSNCAFGNRALKYCLTAFDNIAIGRAAAEYLETGSGNVVVGGYALSTIEDCVYNTVVGGSTLEAITEGAGNVAIGYGAGYLVAGGPYFNYSSDYCVFIGTYAWPGADGDENEIVIGYLAAGLGSNTCVIGNSDITLTRLFGDLGVGIDAPQEMIHSAAKVRADTGFDVNGTPGIDASFSILDGDAVTSHDFVFTKGILTSYATS